ncbi:hypothetical protein GH5_01987 [Leishmania sp. Ghana 2012 LV757]|uniref:hypothetical protein n=1 Tax=Leishmania sp. Ghana 2012 LV757 TaxID=2803181 RepID=UPI001B461EAE|nr:hypothetical protein GH5_01987 [Leishmania sp. Ghana 2012 LV757]
MSSAACAYNGADDILAFHMRHHDALKGTYAPDVHGNLPRPLRSEVAQLHPAPRRLPAAEAPLSSPYCTPQWTEFSECLREVAPPPFPDGGLLPMAEPHAEPLSRSASATPSLPGYAVVKRLADLSQASDVDPAAVVAALREAERVLQAPMNTDPNLEYAHCNSPRAAERTAAKECSSAGRVRASSSAASAASAPHDGKGAPSLQERHHHQHRRHPYRHSNRSRSPSADCASTAARFGTASGRHTPFPWGWPVPAPIHCGSPAPPRPGSAAINFPPGHDAPFWEAGAVEPTMRWYEVYFSWMLYYRQLYAAQVQQQRRAKRARRQSRREARGRHAAPHAAGSGPEVSTGGQEEDTGSAHVRRRSCAAAWADRGDAVEGHVSGAVGASASRMTRPVPHHRLTYAGQPNAPICASKTPQALHEAAEKGGDDAAPLRAELRRLEERYAVLSSSLASGKHERAQPFTMGDFRNRRSAAASAAGAANAAPKQARPLAPTALRAQGGKWYSSCYDGNSTSQRGSVAPADTWQALSERQRNGTLSAMARHRTNRASASQ